jgi:hypothetical protein
VAFADVWLERRSVGLGVLLLLLKVLLLLNLLKYLRRSGTPRPIHTILGPATRGASTAVFAVDSLGPPWTSIIAMLAMLALQLATDMDLACTASGRQTPAPPRSVLSSVNLLKLEIPADKQTKAYVSRPKPLKKKRPGRMTMTTNLLNPLCVTAASTSSFPIFCSHSGHEICGVKTVVSICDSTHSFRQRLHVLIMCTHAEVGLLLGN